MTIRDELAAIRERAENATEGPWEVHEYRSHDAFGEEGVLYECADILHRQTENVARHIASSHDAGSLIETRDATFIAHARTDVPRLVSALQAVLEQVELSEQMVKDSPSRMFDGNPFPPMVDATRLRLAIEEAMEAGA